jgi:hypothetical protein
MKHLILLFILSTIASNLLAQNKFGKQVFASTDFGYYKHSVTVGQQAIHEYISTVQTLQPIKNNFYIGVSYKNLQVVSKVLKQDNHMFGLCAAWMAAIKRRYFFVSEAAIYTSNFGITSLYPFHQQLNFGNHISGSLKLMTSPIKKAPHFYCFTNFTITQLLSSLRNKKIFYYPAIGIAYQFKDLD